MNDECVYFSIHHSPFIIHHSIAMLKTLIIGATANPERTAFTAAQRLKKNGQEVVLIGNKSGEIDGNPIHTEKIVLTDIDTVTLYINPKIQTHYYDYILSLHPRRIIFNPGTENRVFKKLAEDQGIETENACTLVLLSLNEY